jgi:hypothetical protein
MLMARARHGQSLLLKFKVQTMHEAAHEVCGDKASTVAAKAFVSSQTACAAARLQLRVEQNVMNHLCDQQKLISCAQSAKARCSNAMTPTAKS